MKTKTLSFFILPFILFSGCSDIHSPQVIAKNQQNLKNGTIVGKLADGRTVTQFTIDQGDNYAHFLYLIENSSTATINYTVNYGKVYKTQSIVIDGQEYKIEKVENKE